MTPDAPARPLRSVHTADFPDLLAQLGASLLVTTYQAGKLVVVRADGPALNTHFRGFNRPMGLALAGDRLAIGVALEIWEYRNVPSVGRRLDPAGRHDACFMPRAASVTGDVQIHEMAWAGDDLWFVNTRFSCLCTRSTAHSFAPRWRPAFTSALAPEDRCHLNGLGLRDGRPRYVTALGRGDAPASWRAHKKDGGVLMDVPTNEIIVGGLSMPHSPRWHAGRLWVLESGTGRVAVVDAAAGRIEPVAQLPGFTARPRLLRPVRLRGPVAGARKRVLRRRPPDRSGRASAPAASGCCTSRRDAPWPSCDSRTPSRRSSPCRSCPAPASRT